MKKVEIDHKKNVKKLKKGVSDFKVFISRGNVVDMAVGVIIGGAFGKIVTSLVLFDFVLLTEKLYSLVCPGFKSTKGNSNLSIVSVSKMKLAIFWSTLIKSTFELKYE